MIKVFDREKFVEEVFEMEAEYLEQFALEASDENEEDELNIWFEDFNFACNCDGQSNAFIDYGYIPF